MELDQAVERGVGAAVIDADDLPGGAEAFEHRQQLREERVDTRSLIMDRYDDRDFDGRIRSRVRASIAEGAGYRYFSSHRGTLDRSTTGGSFRAAHFEQIVIGGAVSRVALHERKASRRGSDSCAPLVVIVEHEISPILLRLQPGANIVERVRRKQQ